MAQALAAEFPADFMNEDFASLLDESLKINNPLQGSVLKGRVIGLENDFVVIDVGLKSEGRVSKREFITPGKELELKVGDSVDVFLERLEDREGMVVLSREKARREESWLDLDRAFQKQERVNGIIYSRVKGGFTVDLGGATAFLPGSQVDIRPVKDVGPLMGTPQPFMILKMDRARGNIVVSRRAVLEESRAEARSDLIKGLKEGQIHEGVVKNITDYGAFIDLGGVDGLLHVTDISWQRINHPSEALQIGQAVTVQVVRFNQETGRISLGMKQLEADPWQGLVERFPVGLKTKGRVTNITDYGAFVEIEPGIEGLVHVSEMSWTKKNVHPGKIVSTSQEVDVQVLDIDMEKRRVSLGIKQCQENPWNDFAAKFKEGDVVTGEAKNTTEFGLFVGLDGDLDGMVHLSDLSWDKPGEEAIKEINKGDKIQVKILEIDIEKERIALGIKQLSENPGAGLFDDIKKGETVTCVVSKVTDGGIEVTVKDNLEGFIKKAELSRDRAEQRPDRFAIGEKVDAQITNVNKGAKKLELSIKARELAEDKAAIAEYGSSDSGASLGDILGAALEASKKKK
ncbi:MAG: ribosomal protein [Alphaproteobacteria bacterium]|nr:ribosomal protein [Alphaproteobacteria bacterium]